MNKKQNKRVSIPHTKNVPITLISFGITMGLLVLLFGIFVPVDSANGICTYDKHRLSLIRGDIDKLKDAKGKAQRFRDREDALQRNIPAGTDIYRGCSEPKSPGYDMYIL